MQLTGTIKVKRDEQTVTEKFRKREFVLVDNSSQYPQIISFQLTQDRCSLLDAVQVGETVTVHFNIRGREWTSPQGEIKYFNTLEAWKIDRNAGSSSQNRWNNMRMFHCLHRIKTIFLFEILISSTLNQSISLTAEEAF